MKLNTSVLIVCDSNNWQIKYNTIRFDEFTKESDNTIWCRSVYTLTLNDYHMNILANILSIVLHYILLKTAVNNG